MESYWLQNQGRVWN